MVLLMASKSFSSRTSEMEAVLAYLRCSARVYDYLFISYYAVKESEVGDIDLPVHTRNCAP